MSSLAALEQATSDLPTGDDLTRFQVDTLAALEQLQPTKGLRVMETLEERFETDLNHGRMYPNLDQLVEQGLIAKTDGVDERSNSYELTSAGQAVLDERREWLAGDGR